MTPDARHSRCSRG